MRFDDIFTELGDFGRYQKFVYFLACLTCGIAGMHVFAGVFLQVTPAHRCAIPGLSNDTYESQGPWHDELVNAWIPWDNATSERKECVVRVEPESDQSRSCKRFVYSQDHYLRTIVTDIDLVCDREYFVRLADILVMSGMLVGSVILGLLSERFGCKNILVLCTFGLLVSSTALVFANTYTFYTSLRFAIGFFCVGMFQTGFVLGVEVVGPKKRKLAGILIVIFRSLIHIVEAGVAYVFKDWRHFQIAITAPALLALVVFILFLPQSPRWLIQKGKTQEAADILHMMARKNGAVLSGRTKTLQVQASGGKSKDKFCHLLLRRFLLIRCLILFFNNAVSSMVFNGLTLGIGKFSGNTYFNFFVSVVGELLALTLCLVYLDKAGRRRLQFVSMTLCGVACAAAFLPEISRNIKLGWVEILLCVIGKSGASVGWAVVGFQSAELFPTTVRNSGVGVCSFFSRIGGIAAPFVWGLGEVTFPMLIFGVLSVVAGVASLILPETSKKVLPDTIDDVIRQENTDPDKMELEDSIEPLLSDEPSSPTPTCIINSSTKVYDSIIQTRTFPHAKVWFQ